MSVRNTLFGFKGRARRQDWWLWGIAVGVVSKVIEYAVEQWAFAGALDVERVTIASPAPMLAATLALSALYLWPMAALSARRAHDLNWPAWPVLIAMLVTEAAYYLPFELTPAYSYGPHTNAEIAITAATTLYLLGWILMLIWLAFIDGTQGPNRFGPSPKAAELPDAG